MRVGGLRRRVDLQTLVTQPPGQFGGPAPQQWSTVISLWARLDYGVLKSTEVERSSQQEGARYVDVRVRYVAGVTSMHRLLLRPSGRVLSISAVLDLEERHREMILRCYEVA